jgi:hypothetical protein
MVPAQTALSKTAAASRTRFAAIETVHGAAGSTIDGSPSITGRPRRKAPISKSRQR